ncbi:hypothetical protein SAMN05660297_01436 [Natronincola peptidivorans]|uniref:DUF5666 domain-containing protein n=1 Tax=Natronincola peptidivorans TaxID=426128 RepID=A0A1I0BW04_9FIRM|nr:hypothetical protein [Natronincola peptidivorans]SET11005.1 hypothetical protein SAMN05660297_01436 [Natronincola peptidivorans]
MKRKLASMLVLLMVLSFSLSAAAAFVPPGLAKKGGLPPGIQKRFLDGIIVEEDKDQEEDQEIISKGYSATIERIDVNNRRIMIEEGTAYLYLLVDKDAKIELDEKTSKFEDLRVKDEVYLKLNKENTVIEITGKSIGERESIIREAVVKTIDYRRREITLQHNNREALYEVHQDAVIEINGIKKEWRDIEVGMKVDVKVKEGVISEIKAVNKITRYEGRLISKYTGTNPTITLRINNEDREFNVKRDVDLSKLGVGSIVVIQVENNVVIRAAEK